MCRAALIILCAVVVEGLQQGEALTAETKTQTQPHLVFQLVDDWGWYNAGFHGNDAAKTPFLDSLVREEGLLLERHYVFKFCSPSRRSFLTGRFPPHSGQLNDPGATIDYRFRTIAEVLRDDAGYATAHFGKWHAGHFSMAETPRGRGFEASLGYFNGQEDHWTRVDDEDGCGNVTDLWDDDDAANDAQVGVFGDDLYAQRVLDVLSEADGDGQPVFVYWAMQVAHSPMEAPDRFVDAYADAPSPVEYAFVGFVDEATKNATDALKKAGGWDRTLWVVAADNGGPAFSDQRAASNFPLRGGKYALFEGGVRGNAFVTGGLLPPARRGATLADALHVCDWYATFARLASVDPGGNDDPTVPPLDSVDQWPVLAGLTKQVNDPPRVFFLANGTIVVGNYKLLAANAGAAMWTGPTFPAEAATGPSTLNCSAVTPCLFDVVQDPREEVDLAPTQPDLVANLSTVLDEYMRGVFESIPDPAHVIPVARVCNATALNGGRLTPGDYFD